MPIATTIIPLLNMCPQRRFRNLNMDNSLRNLSILSAFLATIIIFFIFWELITTDPFYSSHEYSPNNIRDELEVALEKASTANKTVIIAFINEAYVEAHENEYPSMFDIFLEGFWVGEETRQLLDHILVVSMDKTAHQRCRFRRLNCYQLAAEEEFAGEKVFMSGEFIEMMWRRTQFLLQVLNKGYNFIFTDTDVLWLRNPFKLLMGENETLDFQISTDKFNGDPFSDQNQINTGFYFIRSNNKTTSLFQKWYEMRLNLPGWKEQDVLGKLIRDKVLRDLNISAKFLNTLYFSGFCSDSQDVGLVATVHANCCRTIKAKVVDLKAVLRDWKKRSGFGDSRNNATTNDFRWTRHISCVKSWQK